MAAEPVPGSGTALARVCLAALVLTAGWIGLLAWGASKLGPVSRGAFVVDYDGRVLDDGLEILLVQSDGQAFATQARDPFLREPERFRTAEEASYRSQRPLLGWVAAALSFGRSGWVPPALAIAAALGAAAAVAGCGALIQHRDGSPWWALSILVLPGTVSTLSYLGPEPMVLALLAWALVAWERQRAWAAVALFALAVLGRETAVLVPGTLGLLALRGGRDWRGAGRLLVVPAVMAVWYVVLRVHVGAWPWEASSGRLRPPLVGIVIAARDIWTDPGRELLFLTLPAVAVVASVVLARRDHLVAIVLVHALFATALGEYVWAEVDFHSRVLLPMYALAIVAVARSFEPHESAAAHPSRVGETVDRRRQS
jgi:hypothetical protein